MLVMEATSQDGPKMEERRRMETGEVILYSRGSLRNTPRITATALGRSPNEPRKQLVV